MLQHYTDERNIQIVISLLKAHGIKRVVASPGTTNLSFVASIQQDSFFEIYSAADERSAAYIACGMAAESGEAVVLSCTGATASRNYMPALTEAYYRNLPVLAITSAQHSGRIGALIPQVIDRFSQPNEYDCQSQHSHIGVVSSWHRSGPYQSCHSLQPGLFCKRIAPGPQDQQNYAGRHFPGIARLQDRNFCRCAYSVA